MRARWSSTFPLARKPKRLLSRNSKSTDRVSSAERSEGRIPWPVQDNRPTVRKVRGSTSSNTHEEKLTQTQLQELLETEPARVLLEGAEERGFVLPAELEAFALEHDLAAD